MWVLVAAAQAAPVEVVVAARDLDAGAVVGGADVRVVKVPTAPPEGAVKAATAAIGRTLVRRVLAGEVLREERFDPAWGVQIDGRVPPGRYGVYLALSGTVGDVAAVGAGGCVVGRDAPIALWQTADGAVSPTRPEGAVGAWVGLTPADLGQWPLHALVLVDGVTADCAKGAK